MMEEARSASMHQRLEQARANAAWELVSDAKTQLDGGAFEKYEALVKGFPATINNNGLGQAIAFLFAKKRENKAADLLLSHLGMWLTKSNLNGQIPYYPRPYEEDYAQDILLQCIRKHNSTQYIQATLEALAFLQYLRRFAAGLSEDSKAAKGEKA